jgi:hypothetical protein
LIYRLRVRFHASYLGRIASKLMRIAGKKRKTAADFIGEHVARGESFADVGCMWMVNGRNCFVAEQAGAGRVVGVDVTEATPEFLARHQASNSSVEFVHGDATSPEVMAKIGVVDVVFCSGVLYHHPSPYELLLALREICGRRLLLATQTIPEMRGVPNAAVYWPMLSPRDRRVWSLKAWSPDVQVAISTPYDPATGYSNWFWGMTPSCVGSLLATAGFHVESYHPTNPFHGMFVCSTDRKPIEELRGRLRIQ